MGHKEWETDEFLDDLLDFDYKKPVPEHAEGKHSKGLPAKEVTQKKQNNKSFGLGGDFDDYKAYEALRHGNDRNAGDNASAKAEANNLRSSAAFQPEIMEPLSARHAVRPAEQKADKIAPPLSGQKAEKAAPLLRKKKAEKAASPLREQKPAETVTAAAAVKEEPAPVAVKAEASASAGSGLKGKLFGKRKHVRASELATEALGAAKKLVTSEEDLPPEEIPTAAASSLKDIENMASASAAAHSSKAVSAPKPAEEKDELAELFAELGETPAKPLTSEDNEALRQAQQDAYDRYRGNYLKGMKKKISSNNKVGWFPKWTSRLYLLAALAFVGSMTIMNVLPFGMLIAFYVIIGLLSLIIVMQLRKGNVRKWARGLASVAAILLIACFGVGTAYAMGTLSFLDFTSVSNEKRVAAITRQPFNVCITGIDVYGTIDEQGRSDVNMIVTVNPKTEQILMTSIPRDYQIYMPDKDMAMDKLTHTGFYSVDTTIGAEENLLDIYINYYVKVNFTTVKAFIYAIGGIDVYSEYEFTPVKRDNWTVKKGWNHMDGKQALAFARERKAFIDGDNQRIKNQQAVFEAIIKKATSSKTMLLSYNKILSNLRDYFQMSFSSGELRSLLKLQLAKNPQWKIYKNTIVGGNGSMPTYSTGSAYAYVMTQDPESIDNAKKLINAVLEGKTLDKDDDDNVFVVEGEESGDESGENAGVDGESDGE